MKPAALVLLLLLLLPIALAGVAGAQSERRIDEVEAALASAATLLGRLRSPADTARLEPEIAAAADRIAESRRGLAGDRDLARRTADEVDRLRAEVRRIKTDPALWPAVRDLGPFADWIEEEKVACRVNLRRLAERFGRLEEPAFEEGLLDRLAGPIASLGRLDPQALRCPGGPGRTTDYATWSAGRPAADPDLPLLWDAGADHHDGVRLVLSGDGRVVEMDESAFETRLATWQGRGYRR